MTLKLHRLICISATTHGYKQNAFQNRYQCKITRDVIWILSDSPYNENMRTKICHGNKFQFLNPLHTFRKLSIVDQDSMSCDQVQLVQTCNRQVCILQEPRKCCFHAFVAQQCLNRNQSAKVLNSANSFCCRNSLGVGIPNLNCQPSPRYAHSKFILFSLYFSS